MIFRNNANLAGADVVQADSDVGGWWRSPTVLLAVAVLLVGGAIAVESVVALAIVLLEGTVALAVLAGAALAGGWIVRLFGLKDEPWSLRLVIGSALGIGFLSLMVLGLGSMGMLTRPIAGLLVVVIGVAGLVRFALDYDAFRRGYGCVTSTARVRTTPFRSNGTIEKFHWAWLLIGPFVLMVLLAACLPPGILWSEEAFGYDVLEYHLAVPKTYFETGRIDFLPYNVYSNFPLNSEMLSLLMMTLRGDAIEASFMAVFVNVGLAGLFVGAAWLAGRMISSSPASGVLAGVLAGVTPWMTYLAGIAYVEVGMLAMGMGSLVAILRARQREQQIAWLWIAGLLAGFSAGYKYTALPLIALPIVLLPLFLCATWQVRLKGVFIVGMGVVITLSPWWVRNIIQTGNPVFPLAYSVFGAKQGTWDDELNERWEYAHSTSAAHAEDRPIVVQALQRTMGDFRLGLVGVVLAAAGAVRRRDRWTAALVTMLLLQSFIWFQATHLFARFAVVLLLPMIVLASRVLENLRSVKARRLVWIVLVTGTGWNLYPLARLYYHHTRIAGVLPYGRTNWFADGVIVPHLAAINVLGDDANVMLVGDARSFYVRPRCDYAVVFSSHPLAEAARQVQGDARRVLQWLQQRGTTHVFVHWGEIERLRNSYGFYPEINADLFVDLKREGLQEIDSFSLGEGVPPYGTLYEVRRYE